MKKPSLVVSLSALALFLVSCQPLVSVNPLSGSHDFPADARLEGIWNMISKENDSFFNLVFVPIDDSLMKVDVVHYNYEWGPGLSGPVIWSRYRVFRTEIDGSQYLNLKPTALGYMGEAVEEPEEPDYWLVEYEISEDGSLTIWLVSDGVLKRDIKDGKVAGTVKLSGEVIVTDNSENLHDYFRGAEDLFTEKFTFRKISS
ncbi:MAG: hypothetical protein V3R13_04285 [Nitrososphaerales archaeon]